MVWRTCLLVLCCQVALWAPAASDYNADIDDIREHQDDVNKIIEYIMSGAGRHQAYGRAANVSDEFGHRFTGAQSLEDSMQWIKQEMESEGLEVHLEDVEIHRWVRGMEHARMTAPREVDMAVMALGNSIGTPSGGISAEVLVVKTFEELEDNSDIAEGKIIVYNQEWTNYGESVVYRSQGASRAYRVGGVAALVKSVTPYSLYTLHTGNQNYDDDVDPIPVACLTVEDVEMLQRIQDRGRTIRLNLTMDTAVLENTNSTNLVAEIKGTEYPNETVIFGGHIDSWDVGTGVMDDLGGCVISWQALTMIKALNLHPKRTMRVVLWTAEEVGLIGGEAYYNAHKDEVNMTSLIMEADSGTFRALGIGFTGSGLARAYMEEVLRLTSAVNTSYLGPNGGAPDIGWWTRDGVPTGNLQNANEDYFFYHHTHADTLTMQDPDDLDLCALVWSATAYVVADIDSMLPREGDHPGTGATPTDVDPTGPIDAGSQLFVGYLFTVMISLLVPFYQMVLLGQ